MVQNFVHKLSKGEMGSVPSAPAVRNIPLRKTVGFVIKQEITSDETCHSVYQKDVA